MNLTKYQEETQRTLPDLGEQIDQLSQEELAKKLNLAHMAMGIASEAGELCDAIKRYVAYNKPIDITNIKEEIGDLEWYLSNLANLLNCTLDDCTTLNIDKLRVRYPHRFNEHQAIHRDTEAERVVLESVTPRTED